MNILWIKDGKIGHEKQVKILLDELKKSLEITISEFIIQPFSVKNFILSFFNRHLENKDNFDMVIGAGHSTYMKVLSFKKDSQSKPLLISVLVPSISKNKFDLICAPSHDSYKIKNTSNVIFYEGSLAKVSHVDPSIDIGMVAIGGINKHYVFDEAHISKQIEYMLSIHPSKTWYIFNSRRTSQLMNDKLQKIADKNKKTVIVSYDNKELNFSFDDTLSSASVKLISQDSVNMVYEALSSKGETYIFDMDSKNKNNKVVKQVNKLVKNKQIGFIEYSDLTPGLKKMNLKTQNKFNEVHAEVEKVAYKVLQKLQQ